MFSLSCLNNGSTALYQHSRSNEVTRDEKVRAFYMGDGGVAENLSRLVRQPSCEVQVRHARTEPRMRATLRQIVHQETGS